MKNYTSLWQPIAILTSRGIARPSFQIITGFFNGNLFGANLRKWYTICYLNTFRILLLALINYLAFISIEGESEVYVQILEYFNVCYYGMVGYLMYLETYTL